jgi:hypothetical protein
MPATVSWPSTFLIWSPTIGMFSPFEIQLDTCSSSPLSLNFCRSARYPAKGAPGLGQAVLVQVVGAGLGRSQAAVGLAGACS